MHYDPNGVPVLSSEDIEDLAEKFLRKVAPKCLDYPTPFPLFGAVRRLEGRGHFRYVPANLGDHYLGAFNTKRKIIYIHEDLLEGDPRLPFTVAHELGHFYLHSKVDPADLAPIATSVQRERLEGSGTSDRVIFDGPGEMVLGRARTDNPRSVLEWQANRFAGAILIPRRTLKAALFHVQQHIGITRHLGLIWLTNQRGSAHDFAATVKFLSERYQTSRSVMRIRLYSLDLVREQGLPVPMRRLGDVIGNALNDLFGSQS